MSSLVVKITKTHYCFLILLLACNATEINYIQLNTLIADGKYQQALTKIEDYKKNTSYPLDVQKLNQLYIRADLGLLFTPLNKLTSIKDSTALKLRLKDIFSHIESRDSLSQRWYFFEYYVSYGRYCAIKNDSSGQINNYLKAAEFPVTEMSKKINIYMDLAFHYAKSGQFETARDWLDKALRSFDKNEHKDQLLQVYMDYMNGDYQKADSLLEMIPHENKNLNWQRVESFFNLYTDSLSLKNRFRLW